LVDAYVNGRQLRALLDSGAGYTLISPDAIERLEIPFRIKDEPINVVLADDAPMEYGGGKIRFETTEVSLRIGNILDTRRLNIMDIGNVDMFIGYDWLDQHNPCIDWKMRTINGHGPTYKEAGQRRSIPKNQCTTRRGRFEKISPHKIARIYEKDPQQVGVIWVRKVATPKQDEPSPTVPGKDDLKIPHEYEEFRDLFEEHDDTDLPQHQDWDHEIILEEDAKLKPGRMYPLSHDQQEELRKYIRKNVERGYIRVSDSPMASPILFVPKKNGKLRLCVDFRELNNKTKKNRYPLPLIQELMDTLQGSRWFTKFDVREGFHRIRIKEGHEWMTAFKTRFGLYEYTVMPFGLTNAPATFQTVINQTLHEYLDVFCTAYIDDVLIYGKGTLEEHKEDVKKVLRKLQQNKLLLHPDKCEFHVTKTDYLGFVVSRDGIAMDPKKLEAVRDWQAPKTVKEVQSF
jgi:hypothetical protein